MEKKVENTNTKPQAQTNLHAAEADAAKTEAFKKAKAEAAKRFKEKRAEEKQEAVKQAQNLLKFLTDNKILDKLPADTKAFYEKAANPAARSGGSSPIFTAIFGDTPKVGDKVSLMDVFKKTMKSKSEIDRLIKKWAEAGTVVEFKAASNMIESTYEIKALAK